MQAHQTPNYTVPTATRIGHIHLKVSDIEQSLDFYCRIMGFEMMQRYGHSAAFVSAGGYHHHIGLNTWDSLNGPPPAQGTTGLFHVAILYPTRRDLAVITKRLIDHGVVLQGASNHGVSEAIYLADPDQNGIELYWDRPREEWPVHSDGNLKMMTERLDLDDLFATLA